MEVITYSLRGGQPKSDQYYRDVAAFTDDVLVEAERCMRPLVEAFQASQAGAAAGEPCTWPEHVFDLLTLGILWRVYIGRAPGLADGFRWVLTGLARLRQRVRSLKPGIDRLRGVLATLFLGRNGHLPEPQAAALDQLLGWLVATGDFDEEVKRLTPWRDYLDSLPPDEAADRLAAVIAFAAWFESRSEAVLGRYTPNVERFLADTHPNYRWREDSIFCGRQRVEYHLYMIGTEILNRTFRDKFLGTRQKIVLVPPCMRIQPEDKCQARPTSLGARCAGCTPGCRVHQLTKLGEKHGFGVFMLPDDLRVFSGPESGLKQEDTAGVVGVSCVLTNAAGGWKTQRFGIPAQGVLLDYCGCRWHWHKDGIPTDINIGQLLAVLGLSNAPQQARDGARHVGEQPELALPTNTTDIPG
jgi:hypothetical protein